MKKILTFFDFINESVVTLSDDIKANLKKIYNLVDDESKTWVLTILRRSGINITLDPKNNYNYNLYNSNTKGYYTIEIDKQETKQIQTFKIGKSLKLLVPDIPNHILSKISAALQSFQINNITVVEGEEITNYYRYSDQIDQGTLGRSCMKDKPKRFFDLYKNNKNVKLAILLNEEKELIARALLWNTTNGIVMDRVYYSSDSYEYVFLDWAKTNNYKIASNLEEASLIQLEEIPEYFPYLDTYKYLCINKKQLSNVDVFDKDDQVVYLGSTDGEFGVVRNYKLPYNEVYSISEIYKRVFNLSDLINLSIDFYTWYNDYIQELVDEYENVEDFISIYGEFITKKFDKFYFNKFITKQNIFDLLRKYNKTDKNEYEFLVDTILRYRWSKEEGYNDWKDINLELNDKIKYNYYSKDWIDQLIKKYCKETILNVNLKKLYEENYEQYELITYDWFN